MNSVRPPQECISQRITQHANNISIIKCIGFTVIIVGSVIYKSIFDTERNDIIVVFLAISILSTFIACYNFFLASINNYKNNNGITIKLLAEGVIYCCMAIISLIFAWFVWGTIHFLVF